MSTEAAVQYPKGVQMSPSIAALTAALVKVQSAIEGAKKGKVNPHLKSKYADLASVWDACRELLAQNGLAVYQPATGDGARVTVVTILAHTSGEWMSGELSVTADKATAQGVGSAVTYARRYGLSAMVGITPDDDDDGHAVSQPQPKAAPAPVAAPPPSAPSSEALAASLEGKQILTALSAASDAGMVKACDARILALKAKLAPAEFAPVRAAYVAALARVSA